MKTRIQAWRTGLMFPKSGSTKLRLPQPDPRSREIVVCRLLFVLLLWKVDGWVAGGRTAKVVTREAMMGKRQVAKLGMKAKLFGAGDPRRGSGMLSEGGHYAIYQAGPAYCKDRVMKKTAINAMRSVFLAVVLLAIPQTGVFCDDTLTLQPEVREVDGRRLIQYKNSGDFIWCGNEHLALSTGANGGVRLLNVATGRLRQLTTVKTHRGVACTPDGRYVFFRDDTVQRGRLEVLDAVTDQRRVIYDGLPFSNEAIAEAPLSPSGKYLLRPASMRGPIELNDRVLKVLRLPDMPNELVQSIAWWGDESVYLLFGGLKTPVQRLLVVEVKTNQNRFIELPSVEDRLLKDMAGSLNSHRLYAIGWSDSESLDGAKLFSFDPRDIKGTVRQVAVGVDRFCVMSDGTVFYAQLLDVKFPSVNSDSQISAPSEQLMVRAPTGKIRKILGLTDTTTTMRRMQPSPDDRAVAFIQSNSNNPDRSTIAILILK